MAKVTVRVLGQAPREVEAGTVGELKRVLGVPTYTVSVNRETAADSQELFDDDFATLAPPVKGG